MNREIMPNRERPDAGREMVGRLSAEPQLAFLRAAGHRLPEAEWHLVGGAVRDMLLGREGIKDYDFLVRRVGPDELSGFLSALGRVDAVGRNFGVLKFRPDGFDGAEVDIAWPRRERAGMSGGYRDFSVQSDPDLPVEEDLARRDFTMNAIALEAESGRLIDPFGGERDIREGLIRAVGDPELRFREDYSRMLRAIRQACQLGFEIEGNTWQAIRRLAPHIGDRRSETEHGGESVVPAETVARELLKSLGADPLRSIELLEGSGLLPLILPEVSSLADCGQSPDWHSEGNVLTHTKLALGALADDRFARLFPGQAVSLEAKAAVLLHDIGKPASRLDTPDGRITFYGHEERGAEAAAAAVRRLRLSSVPGFDAERTIWLVRHHLLPAALDPEQARRTTLERYFLKDEAAGRDLLHLAAADSLASVRADGAVDLSWLERLRTEIEKVRSVGSARAAGSPAAAGLLDGHGAMAALGISRPGPAVGRALAELREAQLREDVRTAAEAREFLRARAREILADPSPPETD